ncbi:MAG: sulfite exporter TauE/SafE family protein [Pseudomonadota bacterium]
MTDPVSLLIIAVAFILGGLVKGVAGLGLPVITVAVLTFAFGLPNAMALMVAPGLMSNGWQSIGPHAAAIIKRLWMFIIASLITIWFGTGLLVSVDSSWLVAFLGFVLTVYALIGIFGFSITVPENRETIIGPAFGAVCGVTTGMTGVTSTPSVVYLNALGMKREMFIQSMGLYFFISYIILTASLWARGLLDVQVGSLSLVAVVPTLLGMWFGKMLRMRTSEAGFKKLFYRVLVVIGLYLIVRALFF